MSGIENDLPGLVSREFGLAPGGQRLGAHGGFSGACLWRACCGDTAVLVRELPEAARERLTLIEAQCSWVDWAIGEGCLFLARPLRSRRGQFVLEAHGQLWRVETWMAGKADFWDRPSKDRVAAAATALAQIHSAEHRTQPPAWQGCLAATCAENLPVWNRLLWLEEFADWDFERAGKIGPRSRLAQRLWPLAQRAWDFFCRTRVEWVTKLKEVRRRAIAATTGLVAHPGLTTAVCLRDVWHDHVLYSGEALTGIVDYDAVREDAVATDIARLAGSFCCAAADRLVASGWPGGVEEMRQGLLDEFLACYQSRVPLAPLDLELVRVLDRIHLAAGPISWLSWVYRENRKFDDEDRVFRHIERLVVRQEPVKRRQSGADWR